MTDKKGATPPERMVCLGRLAVTNLSNLLAVQNATEEQLLEALACMRGITWSYPTLVGVGARRVSSVLRRRYTFQDRSRLRLTRFAGTFSAPTFNPRAQRLLQKPRLSG